MNLQELKRSALGGFGVSSHGYYGEFGGAYIPEMLHRNVEELRSKYLDIIYEESFLKEFRELLKDYAGRPTPLYFAKRMSEKWGTKIFLKREDLCHTGAHKINNTIGQILLAQRLGKTRIIAETGAGQHGVATAAKFLNATDEEALVAAFELAKLEGIIPALESAHALAKLKDLTLLSPSAAEGSRVAKNNLSSSANKSTNQIAEQMKFTKDSIVVVCLSGRGDKDLAAYMKKMEEMV